MKTTTKASTTKTATKTNNTKTATNKKVVAKVAKAKLATTKNFKNSMAKYEGSTNEKGAYTLAAFIVLGMVKLTGKQVKTTGAKATGKQLSIAMNGSSSMPSYWARKGWIVKADKQVAVTEAGAATLTARLAGTGASNNTSVELVKLVINQISNVKASVLIDKATNARMDIRQPAQFN